MKPSDITAAIAAGNHDLDSIADALGVNHSNAALRTYLKMLVATGAVTRTDTGDADWPVDRFDLNNA